MSLTSDLMELREEDIQAHYAAALALLEGFDHTPRIGQARQGADLPARSSGIVRARRFRSTTPGMVTRSTQRPEGVRLLERIEAADGGDVLISPLQATVMNSLRRSVAIALAMGQGFAERTGLDGLKRANLQGSLAAGQKQDFAELLAA